jgi:hypothetical protein
VKISFTLIRCLFPALLIIVAGLGVIEIVHTFFITSRRAMAGASLRTRLDLGRISMVRTYRGRTVALLPGIF